MPTISFLFCLPRLAIQRDGQLADYQYFLVSFRKQQCLTKLLPKTGQKKTKKSCPLERKKGFKINFYLQSVKSHPAASQSDSHNQKRNQLISPEKARSSSGRGRLPSGEKPQADPDSVQWSFASTGWGDEEIRNSGETYIEMEIEQLTGQGNTIIVLLLHILTNIEHGEFQ